MPAVHVAPLGALFLYIVRLCDCECVWPWLLLGLVQPLLHDDWLHALPPDQPLQLLQPPKLPLLHVRDLLRD